MRCLLYKTTRVEKGWSLCDNTSSKIPLVCLYNTLKICPRKLFQGCRGQQQSKRACSEPEIKAPSPALEFHILRWHQVPSKCTKIKSAQPLCLTTTPFFAKPAKTLFRNNHTFEQKARQDFICLFSVALCSKGCSRITMLFQVMSASKPFIVNKNTVKSCHSVLSSFIKFMSSFCQSSLCSK